MKQTILIFIVLLNSIFAIAQIKISGTITDNKGKPVVGVSITIAGSYDGGTSDSLGKFSFNSFEKGNQTISVTSIGYISVEQKIIIENKPMTFSFSIKEEITELKAVVINAGSFEASDRKRAVAVLNPIDIVTTASANADITNAIKLSNPAAVSVRYSANAFRSRIKTNPEAINIAVFAFPKLLISRVYSQSTAMINAMAPPRPPVVSEMTIMNSMNNSNNLRNTKLFLFATNIISNPGIKNILKLASMLLAGSRASLLEKIAE